MGWVSFYPLIPPVLLLAKDLLFIAWAGHRLNTRFRDTAVRLITGETSPKRPAETPLPNYFSLLAKPRA